MSVTTTLPFDDLRVLDLSRYGPGLTATMMLGDMGADVIHVAQPSRLQSLQGAGVAAVRSQRELPSYAPNRNKRSIVLDLTRPAGRDIAYQLVKRSDILYEGFRPGVAERLGVGYEQVREINPRLIYCSLSGYGQTGPYAPRPGHDLNYVAAAGGLSAGIATRRRPSIPAMQVGDFAGGTLHSLVAVLTALYHRRRTGRGQYIDAAMTDGVLALLVSSFSRLQASPDPVANGLASLTGSAPFYGIYETHEGRLLALCCNEPKFWENLCDLLERHDLIGAQGDADRWPEATHDLEVAFQARMLEDWVAALTDADVPFSVVTDLADVPDDPHFIQRMMFTDISVGDAVICHPSPTIRMSEARGSIRALAPRAGQHTVEILQEIGAAPNDIADLVASGVVEYFDQPESAEAVRITTSTTHIPSKSNPCGHGRER